MSFDFKNKKILVVAAHPDDELLGAGGTIHHLVNKYNCTVKVVILSEGISSRYIGELPESGKRELIELKKNINEAKSKLNYQQLSIHSLPDNSFDSIPLLSIIKIVEVEKNNFQPDCIFTHHAGDLNIDHRRTFEAVITATRPLPGETVKAIFSFETPSSTEWQVATAPYPFLPNFFIHLNESDVTAKLAAFDCYQSEKREFPHPRSLPALKNLSAHWGSVTGNHFAEAFILVRAIS